MMEMDAKLRPEIIPPSSNAECDGITTPEVYENRSNTEMRKAARASGDFYTPASVIHMMTKLLEVREGSVYDPCCASGALLCQAFAGRPELEFYGQAADEQAYKICQMNAFLHGRHVDLGGKPADVFLEDLHSGRKFDCILSNPPFNSSGWCDRVDLNDPRWHYGIPPRSNANLAWLQHIISHLSRRGRAAVILPNGALTTGVKAEQRIREGILCAGLVEAVIALPPGLFYDTKIPCSLWFLDKSRAPGQPVLLADARHLPLKGTAEESAPGSDQLIELISRHRAGTTEKKTDWYAVVPMSELALNDYNLSPNLYTKKKRIQVCEIQERRSRFDQTAEQLSSRIKRADISELVRQWKTVKPSSQWEKAFLLELYEAFGGISKTRDHFGRGTGMVDVKAVIHNLFVPDTLTASVDADDGEIKKYQIKAGDILLNRTSETTEELACGCAAPEDRRLVYSAYVKRLRPVHKGFPEPFYMAGYLRSAIYRREVEKVSAVYTTRANINMKQLSKIAVYFPERAMQQKLGDTIFAISRFLKEEADEELAGLPEEFIDMLIEQYITYPILCAQGGKLYE